LLINWKQGGLAGAAVAAPEVPVQALAPQVRGLAQAAAAAAAAAVGEAAHWAPESGMFSGEARQAHQARQADPLQAPGRGHHRRHHQATPDRAGPQVEVQLHDLRVLDLPAGVSEGRQHQGQPRPTLAAATQPQPTGAPQWAPPWEDQEQPTLEAADPPSEAADPHLEAVDPHWVEEVLSNQGRLEGALQLVEEALCNPDQATVVQAWWARGWQEPGLEDLQVLELEALLAPLDQGVLGALAVQALGRDLEAQALDLAPAPVLAPTRALAPPALLETGDQALDLRPRPLLGRV